MEISLSHINESISTEIDAGKDLNPSFTNLQKYTSVPRLQCAIFSIFYLNWYEITLNDNLRENSSVWFVLSVHQRHQIQS